MFAASRQGPISCRTYAADILTSTQPASPTASKIADDGSGTSVQIAMPSRLSASRKKYATRGTPLSFRPLCSSPKPSGGAKPNSVIVLPRKASPVRTTCRSPSESSNK